MIFFKTEALLLIQLKLLYFHRSIMFFNTPEASKLSLEKRYHKAKKSK